MLSLLVRGPLYFLFASYYDKTVQNCLMKGPFMEISQKHLSGDGTTHFKEEGWRESGGGDIQWRKSALQCVQDTQVFLTDIKFIICPWDKKTARWMLVHKMVYKLALEKYKGGTLLKNSYIDFKPNFKCPNFLW